MNVIFLDYRGSDNIDDDCEDSSTGIEADDRDGLLRDENDGAGREQVSVCRECLQRYFSLVPYKFTSHSRY